MSDTIHCRILDKQAEPLERAPYPGPLGERILAEVSAEGWGRWVEQQTMLINENRLSMADADARKFLLQEMKKFLFGEGGESAKPDGFKAL
ncbi:MAG: oxidative damage protection protein [Immundisolibacteraceae bacterium]|nr:oxidative damage protection protein [Immundisolibacteraceae bacterium]